jgi:tRNA threonylcarbamoyladenosine biosynthesis protein TsaB
MRILAIDTSGRACSLALFEAGVLIAKRHELIGRGHAEALIPWIAELPGGGRADSILVGCGPGSFTGVRIGVAAARGLGLGWGVPVNGMDSLALIAASAPQGKAILVAIEGGHGELFIRRYSTGPLSPTTALVSAKPDVLAVDNANHIIIGSGAARLVEAHGSGVAVEGEACAALALMLPPALRSLPPSPVYGRAADATLPQ